MVRVQYDYYNRHLKILDEEGEALFEDGDMYTLAIFDSGSGAEVDWIDFRDISVSEA